jgi:multiple sugar transport system ATP-binding protein
MAEITLDGITKVFPDGQEAVKDMSLDVGDGEFMILVGPSGCGKSTALRMIAGLEDVTSGELKIDGEVVNELPPKERDVAMVFQNYALYPHMTVRENMGFALRLAGVPKGDVDTKVEETAEILDLTQHLDRRPANLSGGQRQRVAMGRAIVRDPKAFLMDEPLSNLDAKLRVQMRTEVAKLQSRLETTTVYVTHDQVEAMTLGDRVAVMRAGILQQVGTPSELYERPTNLFVAGFIGSPAMNFMPGELSDGKVKLPIGEVELPDGVEAPSDGTAIAGLRPESFEDASLLSDSRDERGIVLEAEIDLVESLGSDLYAYFHFESEGVQSEQLADLAEENLGETGAANLREGKEQIIARLDPASRIRRGDTAKLWADTSKLHLFDPETGQRLAQEGAPSDQQQAEVSGSRTR